MGQPGLNDVHGDVYTHAFGPGTHRLLVHVATADPLTVNLRLRTPEATDAEAELRAAASDGRHLSAALLDIDHFKRVNEVHGHAVGNRVAIDELRL